MILFPNIPPQTKDSEGVSSYFKGEEIWETEVALWVYQQVVCWRRCVEQRCLYEELFPEQNGNQSQCVWLTKMPLVENCISRPRKYFKEPRSDILNSSANWFFRREI